MNAPAQVQVEHDGLDMITVRVQTASGVVTYKRTERRSKPRSGLDVVSILRHVSGILAACSFKRLLNDFGFDEVQS